MESLATILGELIRTRLGVRREIVLTSLTRLVVASSITFYPYQHLLIITLSQIMMCFVLIIIVDSIFLAYTLQSDFMIFSFLWETTDT